MIWNFSCVSRYPTIVFLPSPEMIFCEYRFLYLQQIIYHISKYYYAATDVYRYRCKHRQNNTEQIRRCNLFYSQKHGICIRIFIWCIICITHIYKCIRLFFFFVFFYLIFTIDFKRKMKLPRFDALIVSRYYITMYL